MIFIHSFIPWFGGKADLAMQIVARFPPAYQRYVEVFGGGASVLFAFKNKEFYEVYNDIQDNVVNLFRVVKTKPLEFLSALDLFPFESRSDFASLKSFLKGNAEYPDDFEDKLYTSPDQSIADLPDDIQEILESKKVSPDVIKAVAYYRVIKLSYAARGKTFCCRPVNLANVSMTIMLASNRLQSTVIENLNYDRLIKLYDRPDTFFYCDPPYFNTDADYNRTFKRQEHQKLHDQLMKIQGKFLLSYNDCPEIRSLYNSPNLMIESLSRSSNLEQKYNPGKTYSEILIANYDIDLSSQSSCYGQTSLPIN